MFDLTPQIKLEKKDRVLYFWLRISLYLIALLFFVFILFSIFFPNRRYIFSFETIHSEKNTLPQPYLKDNSEINQKEIKKEGFFFSAIPLGSYSKVKINLKSSKNSSLPSVEIFAKKSYRAFSYPEDKPFGFKNGTLIKNEADYFIISEEKARKFSSPETLKNLGYSPEQFMNVSKEELRYNLSGNDISFQDSYPNSSLFKIEDNFYILENQTLKKFFSREAFLSQYEENQAIVKNPDFLNIFPVSEQPIGFADGTLVSNGISVYIISSGKIFPVNNPETFQNKGFLWEDIIPIGEDEMGFYEKTKLFTIYSPHPDGTVFQSQENSQYYLIKENKKHLLPSEKIAQSWLKKSPVKATISDTINCQLKKNGTFRPAYSCEMILASFENLTNSEYQFQLVPADDFQASSLEVIFKKDWNISNLKMSLLDIFNKIILRYGISISK